MKISRFHQASILVLGLVFCAGAARGQRIFDGDFSAHNSNMAKLQPAFITPLVEPDPRLLQYARASFSHEYTAARTETTNYGSGRGMGVIAGDRFEFDYVPPAYLQHNSTAVDGFGDMTALAKYRIASANAQRGNYDVAVMVAHSFTTGSYKNGALTDTYMPTLASGFSFKRFDVMSSLGGLLPTGKIASQGRSISWSGLMQAHVVRPVWFEVENNACFYVGGPHGGKASDFITPAAFFVIRPKNWAPAHPFFIVDSGMQIAASSFHTYNHNLISEVRMLF